MFLVPVKNLLNNTTLLHKLLVKPYSYLLLAYCTVFWWLPSHFPSWSSCDVLKWPQKRGAKGTRPFYTSTLRVQLSLHIYNVWQGLTYRVWSGTVSCWLSVTVLWSSVLRWRIPQSDSYFDWFTMLVDPRHTWLHFRLGSSPNRRRDKWPRIFRATQNDTPTGPRLKNGVIFHKTSPQLCLSLVRSARAMRNDRSFIIFWASCLRPDQRRLLV